MGLPFGDVVGTRDGDIDGPEDGDAAQGTCGHCLRHDMRIRQPSALESEEPSLASRPVPNTRRHGLRFCTEKNMVTFWISIKIIFPSV